MVARFLCPLYVRDPRRYHGPTCGDVHLSSRDALFAHVHDHLHSAQLIAQRPQDTDAGAEDPISALELERMKAAVVRGWAGDGSTRGLSPQGTWDYLWLTLFPQAVMEGAEGRRFPGRAWLLRETVPRESLQWMLLGENRGGSALAIIKYEWMVWSEGVEEGYWGVDGEGMVVEIPRWDVELTPLAGTPLRKTPRPGPSPLNLANRTEQQDQSRSEIPQAPTQASFPAAPRRTSRGCQLGFLFGTRSALTAVPGQHLRPVTWSFPTGNKWAWLLPPNGGVMGQFPPLMKGIQLAPLEEESRGECPLPSVKEMMAADLWNDWESFGSNPHVVWPGVFS